LCPDSVTATLELVEPNEEPTLEPPELEDVLDELGRLVDPKVDDPEVDELLDVESGFEVSLFSVELPGDRRDTGGAFGASALESPSFFTHPTNAGIASINKALAICLRMFPPIKAPSALKYGALRWHVAVQYRYHGGGKMAARGPMGGISQRF